MKIISNKYGIIHAVALCDNCIWDAAINIGEANYMQNLRNKVYKHIKETGHTVDIETGSSTVYYKEDR